MLTHANLTAAVSSYDAWYAGQDRPLLDDKVLLVLPLFHIYALTTILLRQVKHGNEMLLREKFDAEAILARHRGQARHLLPGRADDVDRAREPPRHREPRPVLAALLRLRRRLAAGRGRGPLRAPHRPQARRRLGHDRDRARRHQPAARRAGQARLDGRAAARHRDGHPRRSTTPAWSSGRTRRARSRSGPGTS